MKKRIIVFAAACFALIMFAGAASAHVTVFPREAVQGSYEKFTVRVPSEKDIETTEVKVRFPEGVNITRFEPKPDWSYELEQEADGKIVGVTWKATGSGLGPTEFSEFSMTGKIDGDAQELVWKAYQTYKDGSVVEWVGAPDSDTPASVTKLVPGSGDDHGHSHGAAEEPSQNGTDQSASSETGSASKEPSNTPLYLSVAAVALGIVSLLVALTRKPKR